MGEDDSQVRKAVFQVGEKKKKHFFSWEYLGFIMPRERERK